MKDGKGSGYDKCGAVEEGGGVDAVSDASTSVYEGTKGALAQLTIQFEKVRDERRK
jgi:hypothetical protein